MSRLERQLPRSAPLLFPTSTIPPETCVITLVPTADTGLLLTAPVGPAPPVSSSSQSPTPRLCPTRHSSRRPECGCADPCATPVIDAKTRSATEPSAELPLTRKANTRRRATSPFCVEAAGLAGKAATIAESNKRNTDSQSSPRPFSRHTDVWAPPSKRSWPRSHQMISKPRPPGCKKP